MARFLIKKDNAIPAQSWTDPEGSRRLRLPDFKTVGTSHWSTKFNFFFLAHEEKYLILIELLTLNSNV